MIAMVGARCKTEIITISTNFSLVSYDKTEYIFDVLLLDLDLCLYILEIIEF